MVSTNTVISLKTKSFKFGENTSDFQYFLSSMQTQKKHKKHTNKEGRSKKREIKCGL